MLDLIKRFGNAVLPATTMQALRALRAKTRGDNPELKFLPQWNHGGIFKDVGANIGDWSRVATQIFRHTVAFEPIPGLALKLRNELPHYKSEVFQVALSDKAGEATLYIPAKPGGKFDTGLASLDPFANGGDEFRPITVPTKTLDEYGLTDVDVIKIDVEGWEERTLSGAMRTIQANKPVLIVEIEDRHHPGETMQIFTQLTLAGYSVQYLNRFEGLKQCQFNPAYPNKHGDQYVNNFIFLHKGRCST